MPRIQSLDLARGFSVLFIPAIHSVMAFTESSVYTTPYGYFLQAIAEGPGAQLFMMIMGIVFTFKENYDTKLIIKRATTFLIAGYALNTLKFVLPYLSFGLPPGIHRDLQLTPGQELTQLFAMGDILHFAAIALIIMHVVYRIKNYWFWSLLAAIIIIITSPLIWDISDNYIISLFTGEPPRIFFPVISWIVYPLIGLTIGYLFKRNTPQIFFRLGCAGIALISIGAFIILHTNDISEHGFYRTYPGETLLHIGIVLLVIPLWNYIANHFPNNYFLQILRYCSKHITSIYLIQWIFICWWIPIIGYQTLGLWPTILAGAFMTMSTYILNELYLSIKNKI